MTSRAWPTNRPMEAVAVLVRVIAQIAWHLATMTVQLVAGLFGVALSAAGSAAEDRANRNRRDAARQGGKPFHRPGRDDEIP